VDHIEHNDDIDDRMMAELDEAHFVIADLTYARPSVYYEAGYAARTVPVIYTARRDHLAPRADDPMGNYRVHFDLLMKNVIAWDSPTDPVFLHQLGSRIDHVAAPLKAKAAEGSERQEKIAAFRKLSREKRADIMKRTFEETLSRLGFTSAFNRGAAVNFGWFSNKDGVLRVIYQKDKLDYPSKGYFQDIDIDINLAGTAPSLVEIREEYVSFTREKLDMVAVVEARQSDFELRSETSLERVAQVEIPALPASYSGCVVLCNQDMTRSLSDIWHGAQYVPGFRTDNPPVGSSYVRAKFYSDQSFVYEFPTRTIIYREIVRPFGEIELPEDLVARLEAELG
jgi:hypothetical protein